MFVVRLLFVFFLVFAAVSADLSGFNGGSVTPHPHPHKLPHPVKAHIRARRQYYGYGGWGCPYSYYG
ncbi:hypothetical protein L596_008657 [Steinernema carpocapsae]|uniref:Uncharacterized protein n=1 Tax=Steinernema carpocapsae TaxID=34508 RepID=A0A4U5PDG3_STECR|nr:hypothetical protein L596_008657 [Steinernema carpocapsae]